MASWVTSRYRRNHSMPVCVCATPWYKGKAGHLTEIWCQISECTHVLQCKGEWLWPCIPPPYFIHTEFCCQNASSPSIYTNSFKENSKCVSFCVRGREILIGSDAKLWTLSNHIQTCWNMKEGQYFWKYIPQQVGKILLYNPKTRVFLRKYQIPKQNNQCYSLSFTNNISTYLKTRCPRINK